MNIFRTKRDMIARMSPRLQDDEFVFAITRDEKAGKKLSPLALCTFREKEGLALILPLQTATDHGFSTEQPMRCITLQVYSALEGVGLTAAVSQAPAEHDIPCNIVAAFHHDHVFVPSALLIPE